MFRIIIFIVISFLYVLFFRYDIDDITSYMSGFELYFNNQIDFEGKRKYIVVWHLFLFFLTKYVSNPFVIIFTIRFCIVFFTIVLVYKKSKSLIAIFLVMTSTLFMEHVVAGLRQGFAMIFFLWAFIQSSNNIKITGYLLALLIHPISIVWIINDFIASLLIRFKFNNKIGYLTLLFGTIFLISIILFYGLGSLSTTAGDMYDFGITDRSPLNLFLWLVITFLVALDSRHNKLNVFITIALIQFCCLYMVFDSALRIIWSIIPLIIVYYITTIRNTNSKLGLALFLIFTLVHYNFYIGKLI